ncbi:hypothetical protein BAC3_00699 [uncultured bacterium]|nr:hypothetical protein BAC3_00699 [uncultured bacterium]
MRRSSKHNQIAKANPDRTENISFATPELIGRQVVFQILIIGKTMGRARPYLEYRIGKVKEVHSSLVVIEGSRGELYNRPVDKISLLEAGS